jgi:hypothetical protein
MNGGVRGEIGRRGKNLGQCGKPGGDGMSGMGCENRTGADAPAGSDISTRWIDALDGLGRNTIARGRRWLLWRVAHFARPARVPAARTPPSPFAPKCLSIINRAVAGECSGAEMVFIDGRGVWQPRKGIERFGVGC